MAQCVMSQRVRTGRRVTPRCPPYRSAHRTLLLLQRALTIMGHGINILWLQFVRTPVRLQACQLDPQALLGIRRCKRQVMPPIVSNGRQLRSQPRPRKMIRLILILLNHSPQCQHLRPVKLGPNTTSRNTIPRQNDLGKYLFVHMQEVQTMKGLLISSHAMEGGIIIADKDIAGITTTNTNTRLRTVGAS